MCAWTFYEEKHKKSIFVAIPHRGFFTARWNAGMSQVSWPMSPYLHYQSGQPIDVARNIMAAKALQLKCSHVFFLDADVVMRADTISLLYNTHLPLISGAYRSRSPPYDIVANVRDLPIGIENFGKDTVLEVEQVGAGCLLVDMRVFHTLGKKLNEFICMQKHTADAGHEVVTYTYKEAVAQNFSCKHCGNLIICKYFDYRLGRNRNAAISEDYFFCSLVRSLTGIPVFIHLRAVVDHEIGDNMVVNEHGLQNRNTGAAEVK